MTALSRRDALRAVAAGLAVGLAGCESGATDDLCGEEAPPTDSTIQTDPTGNAPAPGASWQCPHHDAARTGYTDVAGPTENVSLAWRASLGDDGGYTWPVVADGTLLATDDRAGRLVALDPTDATEQWAVDDLREPTAPTVVDDLVVVGDRNGLHAFALGDGEPEWTFTTEYRTPMPPTEAQTDEGESSTDGPETIAATATAAGGMNDVTTTPDSRTARFFDPALPASGTIVTQGSGGVYAVDHDGNEQWRAEQVHLGAIADGSAYVNSSAGLQALAVDTGEVQWTVADSDASTEMAIRDGTLYSGGLKEVTAVDAETGEREWTFEGEWEDIKTPAVTPEYVFAASSPTEGSDGGNVYALDRASGDPVWCQHLGFKSLYSPAATSDTVYVGAEDVLEARATDSGDLRWRYGRNRPVDFRGLAVGAGVCYAGTWNSEVFAFAER